MKTLSTGNARYSIWYHIVFLPKYRRKVLTNQQISQKLKETFVEIANGYDFLIDTMEVVDDHVHLFLSAPPRYSPAQIVQMTKSISARVLRKEFWHEIKKYIWEDEFWCDGYFVSTVNDHTTADEIRKYIVNQKDQQKRIEKYNSKQLRIC